MNRNALLTLLGLILLTVGAAWFYFNEIKQVNGPSATPTSELRSSIDESIVFEWNEAEPMRGNSFAEMKAQLLEELDAGSSLEIIGWQDASEEYVNDSLSLAMARALAVKALFPEIDSVRFSLLEDVVAIDSTDKYFQASKMNIIFGHSHH